MIAGFLSFGLIALLYLVTEELLVEAHERPETPLINAMFFLGFLALLAIEEVMHQLLTRVPFSDTPTLYVR